MPLFTRTEDPAVIAARTEARLVAARAEAELARLRGEAEREAAAARRAAAADAFLDQEEQARQQREAKARRSMAEQEEAAARRAKVFGWCRKLGEKGRFVGPLLIVNGAAVYGQIAYAYEHVAPADWPMVPRVLLAAGISAAVESVAVYVGWHAHDALLNHATATAARLRRASYLIAAFVGLINYAHFAGEGMTPTPAAAVFGMLSLLSPWLWGLHTRREQHVQLLREGQIDGTGAVFSAERMKAFPVRTWQARRWSIDHNVSDPGDAWRGYNAERLARQAARRTLPGGRFAQALQVLRSGAPAPLVTSSPRLVESTIGIEPVSPAAPALPAEVLADSDPNAVVVYTEALVAHAEHDGTPRGDCSYCPDPEPSRAPELEGMTKAQVVLAAITALGGDPDGPYEQASKYAVRAAAWAAERGVVIESKYPYDVLRRHQRKLAAAARTASADPEQPVPAPAEIQDQDPAAEPKPGLRVAA